MAIDPDQLTPEENKAWEKTVKNMTAEQQKLLGVQNMSTAQIRAQVNLAGDLAGHMQNASEYLSEYQMDLTKSLRMHQDLAGTLTGTLNDTIGIGVNAEKLGKNLSNNEKIQRDFGRLLADESQVMDDLVLKQAMLGTGLQDEYAQVLATYMIENKITDLNDEKLDNLKADLKKRQEIKHQLDKQLELVEGLAKFQLEVREETEKLRSEYTLLGAKIKAVLGNKELGKAFVKALALDQTKKKFEELNETFDEFRKEGLTVTTALKETGIAVGATFSLSGASIKENAELMSGFASSMGDTTKFSKDTVVEVGKLAKTLGLGMKEAGELQGQLQNMAGATKESATSTMEFAGALAIAAHVAPGAVMKDMAANAEDIAANTKNGGKDMALVSVAAHKLGVEMSSLTKMSAGLLDFENSINKQMEASVLLGREINLDKAREAALNGDILGATKEMLQNVGGEAEFNKMNVVQRKALAEAMGVSVQDLSKMVKNQDQLANLTEEQQTALADGVPLSDVLAANSAGVAKNFATGAASIYGMVVGATEVTKGLREGLGVTKDIVGGFKEGTGFLGKMKGLFKGAFKAPETPPITPPGPTPGTPPGGGLPGKEGMLDKLQKIDAKQMLSAAVAIAAVGAALMLIGLGIKFASEGLAELVKSFHGLSGPEMITALLAIVVVMGAFTWMVSILASASVAASAPLLALGFAFLMIGGGIALAALGIGYMVKQFGEIPYANLMALPGAIMGIGAGLLMMGIVGLQVLPVIAALIALAVLAPRLAMLGGALPKFGGADNDNSSLKNSSSSSDNGAVVASLGQVIEAIGVLTNLISTKKGDVLMDGKKVGDVLLPIIENKLNHKSN